MKAYLQKNLFLQGDAIAYYVNLVSNDLLEEHLRWKMTFLVKKLYSLPAMFQLHLLLYFAAYSVSICECFDDQISLATEMISYLGSSVKEKNSRRTLYSEFGVETMDTFGSSKPC